MHLHRLRDTRTLLVLADATAHKGTARSCRPDNGTYRTGFDRDCKPFARLVHNASFEHISLESLPDLACRGKPADILFPYAQGKMLLRGGLSDCAEQRETLCEMENKVCQY
jgi:hypothetical protein